MTLPRIGAEDLEVDFDDGERLFYQGELFTGEVVEYQGSALVGLETYRDGITDGPVKQWFEDGTLRAEGNMRMGFPVGESRRWHPNGTLAAKRITTEDGHRPLAELEWDENGQQTRSWYAPGARQE
ncbi:hypothetical protein SGFS_049380 [Streptomyces graminofaciens]|uniref:Uncharacterized protein n=1 Tax=Streptomyces graminofaciens TaxID=68212 RepID=A0ABN5VJX3_9ACTN|nr:hypothetical protein [Streptomyces graminofaciens]BBC33644.1 hypothetical protein SGFS_049380 [Streptomyces graminofaciens]